MGIVYSSVDSYGAQGCCRGVCSADEVSEGRGVGGGSGVCKGMYRGSTQLLRSDEAHEE
jgi:hypothetical protein